MPRHFMGVDLGSTTAKAVIVDERGSIRGTSTVQMGAVSRAALGRAIDGALAAASLERAEISDTVGTGYGRRLIADADRTFTEITCHARGAAAMRPGVRLVIDIGGQDSKVIAVDEQGLVEDFAMNDRCAGGTGRFFEMLSRALECEIGELGPLALSGGADLEISSMCATFAETEVVSLLAQGADRLDVAKSGHRSIATRTLGLVSQVGRRSPVVMTGGVARNPAAVHQIALALDERVAVPDEPQITGAYGAALLALEAAGFSYDQATAYERSDHALAVRQEAAAAGGPGHTCATCGSAHSHPLSGPVDLGEVIRLRTPSSPSC